MFIKMSNIKTTLTLKIGRDVLESARFDAGLHRVTLSQIINHFLHVFFIIQDDSYDKTPVLHRLSGIITLDSNIDEFKDFLIEKYDKTVF